MQETIGSRGPRGKNYRCATRQSSVLALGDNPELRLPDRSLDAAIHAQNVDLVHAGLEVGRGNGQVRLRGIFLGRGREHLAHRHVVTDATIAFDNIREPRSIIGEPLIAPDLKAETLVEP